MVSTAELVADVRTRVGDSLRVVATYQKDEIEFHYLRDDVADEYSREEMDEIREHVFLEGLERSHVEALFDDRSLRSRSFVFEDVHAFHFAADDERGHFVSVDSDGLDDLDEFVSECAAALAKQ